MKHPNRAVLQQFKVSLPSFRVLNALYSIHPLPKHLHPGVWFQELQSGREIFLAFMHALYASVCNTPSIKPEIDKINNI